MHYGHIHKNNIEENGNIIYPGSTISLGFDELGKHGMVVGNIEKGELEINFIPLDEEEFVCKNIDITDIISFEDLVEELNNLEVRDNNYLRISLVGNRNFEIDIYKLLKFIENERIIKIKDESKISYDLEKLSNEITLKGLFAKRMKEKLEKAEDEEERTIIEKAIEIGFQSLEN